MSEPVRLRTPITSLDIAETSGEWGWEQRFVFVERGKLYFCGLRSGPLCERLFGKPDNEYLVTVPAKWKNTVLLYLMKERFSDDKVFKDWCDERDIPNEFFLN
jgi:hypothetical protein